MRVSTSHFLSFKKIPSENSLKFKKADFFVRLRGYGKNSDWANEIVSTAETATKLIKKETLPEMVLKFIANGVKNANQKTLDLQKRHYTGILRTSREGWNSKECDLTTSYTQNRYTAYEEKLDTVAKKPLKSVKNINLSAPIIHSETKKEIKHGKPDKINDALNHVFELYSKIFPKYNQINIKKQHLYEINKKIAEIRWILAHATPWMRGSDAISNVFIRAMYKALRIKSYPIKKGISLDLEAYCTNRKDYIKNFTSYFDKKPSLLE